MIYNNVHKPVPVRSVSSPHFSENISLYVNNKHMIMQRDMKIVRNKVIKQKTTVYEMM